jgi:hypothetical protein
MTDEQLTEFLRNGSGRDQMAVIVMESGFNKCLAEAIKTGMKDGIPPADQISGIVAVFTSWIMTSIKEAPTETKIYFALELQETFDVELKNCVANLLINGKKK